MSEDKLQDKFLICIDCGEEFVFDIAAQEYFIEKGWLEDPKRCKMCYKKHKKAQRKNAQQFENRAHH